MWYIGTGGYMGTLYPYGFLFNAVYFSSGRMDVYEAVAGKRTGALAVQSDSSHGEEYVTGFAKPGDGLSFTIRNIHGKSWHIVRFQYASTNQGGNSVSVFVNGRKVRRIDKLCHTGPTITRPQPWLDHSGIYYLNDGANTFEIRQDEGDAATGLCIRRLYASREATYDEGENIALNAAATASFVAPGSTAGAVNDGCAGGGANEWISKHEASGCWVQLDWKKPVTIHKVVLYDRPDPAHRVTSGTLTFSNGSTPVKVGNLQNDGKAGTVITFPTRKVSWVRFTIDGSDSSDNGLAEFEVYHLRGVKTGSVAGGNFLSGRTEELR